MKHGKKYIESAKLIESSKLYDPDEAVKLALQTAKTKFDETMEISVRLGVDPRQADQQGSAYDDNAVKKNIPEHRRTSCTSFYQYTPKDGCLQEICSRAEGKGGRKVLSFTGRKRIITLKNRSQQVWEQISRR